MTVASSRAKRAMASATRRLISVDGEVGVAFEREGIDRRVGRRADEAGEGHRCAGTSGGSDEGVGFGAGIERRGLDAGLATPAAGHRGKQRDSLARRRSGASSLTSLRVDGGADQRLRFSKASSAASSRERSQPMRSRDRLHFGGGVDLSSPRSRRSRSRRSRGSSRQIRGWGRRARSKRTRRQARYCQPVQTVRIAATQSRRWPR